MVIKKWLSYERSYIIVCFHTLDIKELASGETVLVCQSENKSNLRVHAFGCALQWIIT